MTKTAGDGAHGARLPDDCFALPPGVDWTPVDEALDRLRANLRTVTGTETCPVTDAAGRILAKAVAARRSNPPAANAAVDGYAFCWEAGPTPRTLTDGRAAAGHPFSGTLGTGDALRILTGAEIPKGADTVVLQEDCRIENGLLHFPLPKKAGANVRPAGEDAMVGERLFPGGHRLRAADLARLSSTGISKVSVHRPLRVAILSTGDELIAPGGEGTGIPDANRPMLIALARSFGCEVVDLGIAEDQARTVRTRFDEAAQNADAMITTGGASAGDEDHVSRLLSTEGAVTDWRIAVKPGRPLALGMWQSLPVFGLPGNPVAAFVCALIFVRPALALMAGEGWLEPQRFTLPAAFEKRKKPGRREFLRARLRDGRAEVFSSEGSGRIGGLSWAEGLVDLPEAAAGIRPGDPVTYIPFSSFGL